MTKKNKGEEADLQSKEYAFPYHYIPSVDSEMWLSRHWGFSPSYVASMEIMSGNLLDEITRNPRGFRHIDVGCGDGALIHHLVKRLDLPPERFLGIDTDERSIAWAKIFNPETPFVAGDVAELNEKFSSASLVEVLEHIPPDDLGKFLEAVGNVISPGGKAFVTVPSVEKRLYAKHFQHFDFASLRKALEERFDVLEIMGFERGNRVTNLIQRLRNNSWMKIDCPEFNRRIVAQFGDLHEDISGCGRLFAIATPK